MIHQSKKALPESAAGNFARGAKLPAEIDEEASRNRTPSLESWPSLTIFVANAQAIDRQMRPGMIEFNHSKLPIGTQ